MHQFSVAKFVPELSLIELLSIQDAAFTAVGALFWPIAASKKTFFS